MKSKGKFAQEARKLLKEWAVVVDREGVQKMVSVLCDAIGASPSQAVVPVLWMTDSPFSRDGSYLVGDAVSGKAGGYVKLGVMHRRKTAVLMTFFVPKAGRAKEWTRIMYIMLSLKSLLAEHKCLGAE